MRHHRYSDAHDTFLSLQAKEQDLLMPVHTSDTQEEYVGATVIEPVRG